jgi:hypothetical protein
VPKIVAVLDKTIPEGSIMKSLIKAVALVVVLAAPVVSFAQSEQPLTRAEVKAQLKQLEAVGYNPAVSNDATSRRPKRALPRKTPPLKLTRPAMELRRRVRRKRGPMRLRQRRLSLSSGQWPVDKNRIVVARFDTRAHAFWHVPAFAFLLRRVWVVHRSFRFAPPAQGRRP